MDITQSQTLPGVPEFCISGSLDTLEAQKFIDTIQPVITPEIKGLIIDCTDMPYLTSTGLRAIMIVGQKVKSQGAKLVICGLSGLALEIYTASGFASVFPSEVNRDAARATMEADHEGI